VPTSQPDLLSRVREHARGYLVQAKTASFRSIIANAASLGGTTLVTAGLGYLFWIMAARNLPASAVGFAGAAISAMTLLGTAGVLGFGTLLIGELPNNVGRERTLVTLGVTISGAVGTALGIAFAVLAPMLSADLAPLGSDAGRVLLFGVGVGLTSVTLVLDQALIGLSRGSFQLVRNTLFAASKLGLLVLAGVWILGAGGMTIYASWVAGNIISLGGVAALLAWVRRSGPAVRPTLGTTSLSSTLGSGRLRRLGRAALAHHALNLALQAPYLLLPLIATTFLSTTVNAYFYIAWVLAGFVYIGPGHLATALYAAVARAPEELVGKLRFTLGLGLVVSVGAIVVVFASAGLMLGLFGAAYAEEAAWCLRVLSLWALPLLIKDHYVVLCRLQGRSGSAAMVVAAAGVLEVTLAAIGASMDGLFGLSVGWLLAGWLQAVVMVPTVYWAAIGQVPASRTGDEPVRLGPAEAVTP
jgi:O-antigen/teichoic acid export membrane protein